jgi:DNA polymerase III epsilon subunit-like protein
MIVGHNVEFDMKVVGAELLRNGYSDIFEGKLFFCSMKNTIDYCCLPGGIKGLKYPKLQELHSILFGKEYDNAHNSLDDVYATKSCYFKLLKRNLIPKERFDGLQYSPEGWVPVETRPFTSNEIESVSEALIVASQRGKTVQFTMKRGGIMFIPLKPGSLIGVGEVLNLNEAKLEVLKRDDGETSYRVIVRPSLES